MRRRKEARRIAGMQRISKKRASYDYLAIDRRVSTRMLWLMVKIQHRRGSKCEESVVQLTEDGIRLYSGRHSMPEELKGGIRLFFPRDSGILSRLSLVGGISKTIFRFLMKMLCLTLYTGNIVNRSFKELSLSRLTEDVTQLCFFPCCPLRTVKLALPSTTIPLLNSDSLPRISLEEEDLFPRITSSCQDSSISTSISHEKTVEQNLHAQTFAKRGTTKSQIANTVRTGTSNRIIKICIFFLTILATRRALPDVFVLQSLRNQSPRPPVIIASNRSTVAVLVAMIS